MTRRHPAPPRALLALLTSLALAVGLLAAGPMSPATASVAPTGAVEAVAAPTGIVKTADLSKFRPGMIISDSVFFNSSTMDEGRIDSFLRQKVSRCQSGYTCLKDFRQATSSRGADSYCDTYSGEGCCAHVIDTPNCDPSPSSASNCGASCGVVMIRTSRMPASISVDSG